MSDFTPEQEIERLHAELRTARVALAGEAATYLDTLHGASRTLAQQIDGLMAWTQLDRAELRPQVLAAATLIAEAQAQLADACAGRRIEWQIQRGCRRSSATRRCCGSSSRTCSRTR